MEPTDICKQCAGWGESCSLDWYPDYCDPNAGEKCAGYENMPYRVEYETYNNSDFSNVSFCATVEKAEILKESLSKLKHISKVRITNAST